jgi:DNA repair protein RecO (recombination protein O)
MIEWRDEGILLAVRPHGETAAIAEAFCREHGRHAGVVHGGVSRRMRPYLQPGVLASLAWRARLDDQLGTFAVEPIRNRAALALADRLALAGIGAVASLLAAALPRGRRTPRCSRGPTGSSTSCPRRASGRSPTCNGRRRCSRRWGSRSTSRSAR